MTAIANTNLSDVAEVITDEVIFFSPPSRFTFDTDSLQAPAQKRNIT